MFGTMAGVNLSEESTFQMGKLLDLYANKRLGWEGLPMTNTLAYYEHSLITYVKSFITFTFELNA